MPPDASRVKVFDAMRFTLDAGDRVTACGESFRAFVRELGVADPIGVTYAALWPRRLLELCGRVPENARQHGRAHSVLTFAGAGSRNYRIELERGDDGELHGQLIDLAGATVARSERGPERYALLVDNVTELVTVFDRDLALVAFNPPFAASAEFITGRPVHLGDDFEQLFDPEARPRVREFVRRALDGEALLSDVALTLRGGLKRTYEMSLNPVRDDGAVVAVVCIARNVTDRRGEAAARNAVLDAIPDAIIVLRRDGVVVDYYPSSDVPMPLRREDIIGRSMHSFGHLHLRAMAEHLARTFETGETQVLEYDVTVGNEVRRRESRLRAISDDEAIFIVRDVTDARRLMGRLVATDRMVALGTMAAGVGHELNNPLAFVSANLELLANQLREDPPAVQQALTVAQEGVARMAAIVRDLTAFARSEEDHAVVDVGVAIDFALRMTRSTFATVARVEKDGDLDARVTIAESRLGQMLVNLLVNAAQAFAPESDPKDNLVRVRVARGERDVEIAVGDNGVGMSAETVARVFDPFFTTKPPGVGTGLGLWVVQGIVRAAGGEVEVESALGRGTTVRLRLPRGVAAPKIERIGTRAKRRRVLLVDDDPRVLESLAQMLALLHDVVPASSAEEALGIADERVDVVLCDLTMPGTNGLELLEALARKGHRATLCLMTGAQIDDRVQARLGRIQARSIAKPFKLSEVDAVIG